MAYLDHFLTKEILCEGPVQNEIVFDLKYFRIQVFLFHGECINI